MKLSSEIEERLEGLVDAALLDLITTESRLSIDEMKLLIAGVFTRTTARMTQDII